MQCYTELTPPTAVSHSVSLPFLSSKSNNLVVAKTSLLQIFDFKSVVTEVDGESKENVETSPQDIAADTLDRTFFTSDIALQRTEHTSKLVLLGEYPLSGTVTSLARIKALNTKSGTEALLIAFVDAKVSLVEWDPERHCISTISIHYYESGLPSNPWAPKLNQCPNYLTVDPRSRCAALRFGPRHLAILPFRQLGDDLVEDDFDPDLDDPADRPSLDKKMANGDGDSSQTPYAASFILPLTILDPELTFPVHLAFLYEYREPTFGILSAVRAPSSSLTLERRDVINYTVFTLDIDQQASTTILSVTDLPTDINRVMPLPLPVGGALLIGLNEFIHVDQGGKTTAIAVNDFARHSSAFPMTDQSDVGLRLEGCTVEQLSENGDLLVVLASGELAILAFKLDGRSVSGIHVHKVSPAQGGLVAPTGVTCASALGRGKVFLGSEDNDSIVLGWSRKTSQLSRKRSHGDILGEDADISFDEDDIDDEDDIYATEAKSSTSPSRSSNFESIVPDNLTFRVHDKLPNFAPAGDVVFADPHSTIAANDKWNPYDIAAGAQLVYPNGHGRTGGLAVCRRELDLEVHRTMKDIPNIQAVWSFHAKTPAPKGMVPKGKQDSEGLLSADAAFDQFLIMSQVSEQDNEDSSLYSITPTGLDKVQKGDFESEGATVDVGTLAGGTRIVQVRSGEVRCYNSEFGLEQILPMIDEATDEELKIVSVSFCDPYVLILRHDSSVTILEATDTGDLEELERGDGLLASRWLSGCVYRPSGASDKTLAFLLSFEGTLRVFELPNLEKSVYCTEGLPFLPGTISDSFVPRRYAARETLAEILVADIGDSIVKSPYLILRTALDDIVIYQPYHYPSVSASATQSFTSNLRWIKISQPKVSRMSEILSDEGESASSGSTLSRMSSVNGYSIVALTGTSPGFVMKEASSSLKVVRLKGRSIRSIGGFHTAQCDRGIVSVDSEGTLRLCQLPPQTRYGDTGWPTRKIVIGKEVQKVCYYQPKGLYIISTCEKMEFKLPDDDNHKEWASEETTFLPHINLGSLSILHPRHWSIIDTVELEGGETALSMTVANLEVSEHTHERRPFVAVGTAIITGEDQPTRGKVYVFDVINVVPEPNRPETGFRLKPFAKEEVKGAVTALTEIGPQGFLLVAQGQKCLVRGLVEEQRLLPVAFLDVQCFVTAAKVLKGTGMIILSDLAKGLWFTGYMEEPYKMIVLGKSASKMEVLAAEFLPHEKQLFMLAADADKNIHVLQYDPESAKSLSGRRLIHKSTFHTGHFPVGMHLLPSTLAPPSQSRDESPDQMAVDSDPDNTSPLNHVLVVTQTGTLALITPVDELMYLRLNTLQTYLTAQLDHVCALNPRGYRAVESERMGIKGIVDGSVLTRWSELPKQRRVEACLRVGVEESVVRADLEFIGGGGLGYL